MEKQQLSFLSAASIDELRTELREYLAERIPKSLTSARLNELKRGIDEFISFNLQERDQDDIYLQFRTWIETLKWKLWIACAAGNGCCGTHRNRRATEVDDGLCAGNP